MAFVTVRLELQLAVPAGKSTVSPSLARAIADVTSAKETLAALIIAASAWLRTLKAKPAKKSARAQEEMSVTACEVAPWAIPVGLGIVMMHMEIAVSMPNQVAP